MTATNHALTGALVAVAAKRPELAIPIAFLAHFAMDIIPHFGLTGFNSTLKKHSQPLFLKILKVDVLLTAILLISIPYLLDSKLSWTTVLACMVACISPDLVWGWRFYFERRDKKLSPRSLFSRFHKSIQWSETEAGAVTELCWFLLVGSLIIFSQA